MNRRIAVSTIITFFFAALLLLTGCASTQQPPLSQRTSSTITAYVGTYTGDGSRGIYRFDFDAGTGFRTEPVLAAESTNPSYLAFGPGGRVLYAVNELGEFGGAPTGAVSAFAVDDSTGDLHFINQVASRGADPCFVSIDATGKNALVANYTAGTVALFPLGTDGRIGEATSVHRHEGSGPVAARQKTAHAHQIVLDPSQRRAFAVDLGADRLFVYRFDPAAGTLAKDAPASISMQPGSGPRHIAWHPAGSFLYVINELASTVTALRYDPAAGRGEAFQTITTLPPDFSGENTGAEIIASSDGRFLYASNRGHDSIVTFRVEPSGSLIPAGHVSTGGRTPRFFTIDPSGRWLVAANQDSDSIAFFRLDPTTGLPSPVGAPMKISKPVCIVFRH